MFNKKKKLLDKSIYLLQMNKKDVFSIIDSDRFLIMYDMGFNMITEYQRIFDT